MQHLSILTSNTTMANCNKGHSLFWHFELKILVKTLGQAVEDCGWDWSSSEEAILSSVDVRHPTSLCLGPTDCSVEMPLATQT